MKKKVKARRQAKKPAVKVVWPEPTAEELLMRYNRLQAVDGFGKDINK